jgi:hypothetical protein
MLCYETKYLAIDKDGSESTLFIAMSREGEEEGLVRCRIASAYAKG